MKNKRNSVSFALVNITTEQFATFQENFKPESNDFDIEFNTRVDIDIEQKVVGIFTKYSFIQNHELVLILECGCHFKLKDDYWNDILKDNILIIDKGLLTHFLVLTVGTSRGVLHAKKPNWFGNILLPTINVTSIIKEDMAFDLSSGIFEEKLS